LREYVNELIVLEWKPGRVTLCGTRPLHDQRTVSPFLIVRWVGLQW